MRQVPLLHLFSKQRTGREGRRRLPKSHSEEREEVISICVTRLEAELLQPFFDLNFILCYDLSILFYGFFPLDIAFRRIRTFALN